VPGSGYGQSAYGRPGAQQPATLLGVDEDPPLTAGLPGSSMLSVTAPYTEIVGGGFAG
jgi:hypothetical protein